MAFHSRLNENKLIPYTIPLPSEKLLFLTENQDPVYADIYPQQNNQPEDRLTEDTIRAGYQYIPSLKNESPAAFGLIGDSLHTSLLHASALAKQLLVGKSAVPITCDSSFQPPERSMMAASIRDAWFNDLAAGQKPLSDLAKKVPHGIKNDKVLDIILEKFIPYPYAIFFIKCVGINEMKTSNQPVANTTVQDHLNYTIEWTKNLSSYVLKQFEELLPTNTNQNTHSNTRKDKRNSKEISLKSKLLRWKYMINLCRIQFNEGLIHHIDFLKRILDLYVKSTIPNIIYAIPLIVLFLDEFSKVRHLIRRIVMHTIHQLQKFKPQLHSPLKEHFNPLLILIQNIMLISPDMFVSPKIWKLWNEFRQNGLLESIEDQYKPETIHQIKTIEWNVHNRLRYFKDVPIFKPLISIDMYNKLNLDKITVDSNFKDLFSKFENSNIIYQSDFPDYYFNWTMDGTIFQPFRTYILCKVLLDCVDLDNSILANRFYDLTFKYLDTLFHHSNLELGMNRLHYLLGIMSTKGLFSLERYTNRLVARGDLEQVELYQRKNLIDFILQFPNVNEMNDVMLKRHTLLYGLITVDVDEPKRALDHVKSFIGSKLPKMFSSVNEINRAIMEPLVDSLVIDTPGLYDETKSLVSSLSSYIKFQLTAWIQNIIGSFVVQTQSIGLDNWKIMSKPGSSLLNFRQFSFLVSIFEFADDYQKLLEVCLWMVKHTENMDIYYSILQIFKRHRLVFQAMDYTQAIFDTIWEHQKMIRLKGIDLFTCKILKLISQNDSCCHITQTQKQEMAKDSELFLKQTSKSTVTDIPKEFPDFKYLQDEKTSIKKAYSNISLTYNTKDGLTKLMSYTFTLLQKTTGVTANYGSLHAMTQIFRDLHYRAGYVENALLTNLSLHYSPNKLNTISHSPMFLPTNQSAGFISFLIHLIINDCCSIVKVIRNIVLPIMQYIHEDPKRLDSPHVKNLFENWLLFMQSIYTENSSRYPLVYSKSQFQVFNGIATIQKSDLSTLEGLTITYNVIHSLLIISQSVSSQHQSVTDKIKEFIDCCMNEHSWIRTQILLHAHFLSDIIYKLSMKLFNNLSNLKSPNYQSFTIDTSIAFRWLINRSGPNSIESYQEMIDTIFEAPSLKILHREQLIIITLSSLQLKKHESGNYMNDLLQYFMKKLCLNRHLNINLDKVIKPFRNMICESVIQFINNQLQESKQVQMVDVDDQEISLYEFTNMLLLTIIPTKFDQLGHLKSIFLEFCKLLFREFEWYQKNILILETMDMNGISYQEAVLKVGNSIQEQSGYSGEIKLNDLLKGFLLRLSVLRPFVSFIIATDTLDTVPLLYNLVLTCSSHVIANRDLFEGSMDIVGILLDELNKEKNNTLMTLLEKNIDLKSLQEPMASKLNPLLKYSKSNGKLQNLFNGNHQPVVEAEFKPWLWIEQSAPNSMRVDNGSWNSDTSLQAINDTPISLACFDSKKHRPVDGLLTVETLYRHGWRQGKFIDSPKQGMKRKLEEEPESLV
ncbi:hypothetical protein BC833DRAFT_648410 [Globomyces pollinis-pini]|nr:hypothetical protein BC833DRAFT_648410 [Globomyces pollinis-pini]